MAAAPIRMKSVEFRRERERNWRALEGLVDRFERDGPDSLSAKDLYRLPVLYRAALSSLSVARAISLDRNIIEYLEHLCARAFICVYGIKRHPLDVLKSFVMFDFPARVRAIRIHLALASMFLLLGAITAFLMVADDPDLYYSFVSSSLAGGRDPSAETEYLREGLYEGDDSGSGELSAFSTMLFAHNSRIGLLSFAIGFAAGIPAALLLFMNGLMLGAFAWLYHSRGLGVDLWSWLLPHGVTEILALLLCGAAGLRLAHSLILPGRLSRMASLAIDGRKAGVVVIGAVLMLFAAGLIEGFFRQKVQSLWIRYAVAILTTVGWTWYFVFVGRGGDSGDGEERRPRLAGDSGDGEIAGGAA